MNSGCRRTAWTKIDLRSLFKIPEDSEAEGRRFHGGSFWFKRSCCSYDSWLSWVEAGRHQETQRHSIDRSPPKSEPETNKDQRMWALSQFWMAHHRESSCPLDLGLGDKICSENGDSWKMVGTPAIQEAISNAVISIRETEGEKKSDRERHSWFLICSTVLICDPFASCSKDFKAKLCFHK